MITLPVRAGSLMPPWACPKLFLAALLLLSSICRAGEVDARMRDCMAWLTKCSKGATQRVATTEHPVGLPPP